MSHTIKTLVMASLCCAVLAGLGCTQASAQDGSYKIGVVDMHTVLAKYDKRKSKYEELQKEVDKLQTGIDKLSKQIEGAKADYDKRKREMSDTDRIALEDKIKADYADYQNEMTKSQQKIDSMEATVFKEVLKDVMEAIEKVATAGNYHLVLNNDRDPRGAVLYAINSIDITSQIIESLNK